MELKTKEIDGVTYAETSDGKPVYIHEGNEEKPMDVAHMMRAISERNKECQTHREAKEAAQAKLRQFEDISNPEKALEALRIVENLDHKQLIDAKEVDKLKAEMSKTYEEKIGAITKGYDEKLTEQVNRANELENKHQQLAINNAFERSPYIKEKIAVPAEMVQALFQSRFKMEDGKLIGYHPDGRVITSKERLDDPATFEECIETIICTYDNRSHILKGANSSGAGGGGGTGRSGGDKTITRAEFDRMSPIERKQKLVTEKYTIAEN